LSKSSRRKQKRTSFFERRRGDILTAFILIPLAAIAVWSLIGHQKLAAISGGDSATNPIGVQTSANPSETDIASLQAAESGTLSQPALIWFHADW